ncbi:MAG: T9SS type A sorting domain-containing protein [bacterium]|nr:T9SS type A sorting domain-containing protein [bacterium]
MKKIYIVILLTISHFFLFAQTYVTINTPTGEEIEAIQFSQGNIALYESEASSWIQTHGSNAVRVSSATHEYNCHAYAWHVSDGGNWFWINQIDQYGNENLQKYWSGSKPTYQQVTSTNASKVFYPNGDHSARVISPNVFESKWGRWPRYQHSPSDCPYNSSGIEYYSVPPATGSYVICSSESYSGLNISGASYTWYGDNITMSGSGSTGTATKISNGEGWIKANIYSTYSGTTVTTAKKDIWIGSPGQPTTTPSGYPTVQLSLGSILSIRLANAPGATGSNYVWDITGSIQKISGGSNVCVAEATGYGSGNYRVKTSNECGLSSTGGGSVYVKESGGGWPMMVSLFPNPAKSVLNVEIQQQNVEQSRTYYTDENKEVYIYDKQNKLIRFEKIVGNSKQINLNGLKPDLYFVKIKIGDDIYNEKLIISR